MRRASNIIKSLICGLSPLVLSAVVCAGTSASDLFAQPGAYDVGVRTITVARDDDSTFDMQLFYPADSDGLDVPLAAGTETFPAISFGPGFLQPTIQYESTLRHLASWGYFTASTESQFSFEPNKPQYAQDLSDMLTQLEISNVDGGSDLFGRVAVDRFGVSGHSLGGGVSILTAVADPRIRAVANLAAASTNAPPPFPPGLPPTDDPSAIDLITNLNVPVSLISGSVDAIVPPAENGQLMYNNAPTPKILPSIIGGAHCGFVDNELPLFCDEGLISTETQLELTRSELTSFFELYLGDNDDAWRRVWGPDRQDVVGIHTQLDPGFSLVAEESLASIAPGSSESILFTLTNNGHLAQSFELFADDSPWSTRLSMENTPLLAPSESISFELIVEVPEIATVPLSEVLVSARSGRDGATRAFELVHVAVPEPSTATLMVIACILGLISSGIRNPSLFPGSEPR